MNRLQWESYQYLERLGYVLSNVHVSEFLTQYQPQYEGIRLVLPDNKDDIVVFVSQENVLTLSNSNYAHVLFTESQYLLYQIENDTGMPMSTDKMIARDILMDFLHMGDFKLRGVFVSQIADVCEPGDNDVSLSWMSSQIAPGVFITAHLTQDAIQYLPEYELTKEMEFHRTNQLSDRCNVWFDRAKFVNVSFSSKETGWRVVHREVDAFMLMQDYWMTLRLADSGNNQSLSETINGYPFSRQSLLYFLKSIV